jgi:spore germination cell wall hydrolase CwlJ-like protein
LFVRSALQPDTAEGYNAIPAYVAGGIALDGDSLALADTARSRALDCLTMAIAYEAGQEPVAGQQAVAQVILNRTRVARFPSSVCGVVFEGSQRTTGCQFTFTCDGSIRRRLRETTLESARIAAWSVLSGQAPDRVNGATHYHANYVNPYWADTGTRVARIGAHIFYRMPGDAAVSAATPRSGEESALAAFAASRVQVRAVPRVRQSTAPGATRRMFAPWGVPIAAAGAVGAATTGRN